MTLDADLQDDPAEIPRFLAEIEKGFDVVSGWKRVRHDPWHKVLPSRVFNWIVGLLTGVRLHDHNCGMKCYRAEVLREVRLYGELHRFIPVLAAARGFRVGEIAINHRPRRFGQSKYGVRRFVKGFLDLLTVKFLTGFGHRPQHMLGSIGLLSFLFGGARARLPRHHVDHSHLASRRVSSAASAAALDLLTGRIAPRRQLLSIGAVAELLIAHQARPEDSYSIAERTDGAGAMTVEPTAQFRRQAYRLMTVVAVAMVCARILSAERVYEPSIHRAEPPPDPAAIVAALASTSVLSEVEFVAAVGDRWAWIDPNGPTRTWPHTRPKPSPTFSSNDRSRWAMVRALVDEGTFAIGYRNYIAYGNPPPGQIIDFGIVFEDGWESIDKVLHPQTHVYYSSKPPLLPVIAAGEYWLLQKLFGWRIDKQTKTVVCTILLTINAVPFAIYLVVLAQLDRAFRPQRIGGDYSRSPPPALRPTSRHSRTRSTITPWRRTPRSSRSPPSCAVGCRPAGFAVSGLFAGLTAAFELPATAFAVALGIVALTLNWRRALLWFAPAALLPIVGQLALNYAEFGDWKPAYEKLDSEWYRYEGSHWNAQGAARRGIDYAGDRESRGTYAFHLLLGHHGLFSLTPIWLLLLAGFDGIISGRWRLRFELASRVAGHRGRVRDRDCVFRGDRQHGELRRLDERPSLVLLADAAVAAHHPARRGLARCITHRSRICVSLAGVFGFQRQLCRHQSLAASVDLSGDGSVGLEGILRVG